MRLDEEELCTFVQDFLALSKAPCRREDEVYTLQGDHPLLAGVGQLSFTFSREKSAPDLDHLTYGHPPGRPDVGLGVPAGSNNQPHLSLERTVSPYPRDLAGRSQSFDLSERVSFQLSHRLPGT